MLCDRCLEIVQRGLVKAPAFDDEMHALYGAHLGPIRWEILCALRRGYPDRVVSHDQLIIAAGSEMVNDTLRVHIAALRRALRRSEWRIVTVFNHGYKLERPASGQPSTSTPFKTGRPPRPR
jgi:DNA-binding winged helix-turn-helix (wHTH) protein